MLDLGLTAAFLPIFSSGRGCLAGTAIVTAGGFSGSYPAAVVACVCGWPRVRLLAPGAAV